MDRKGRGKEPFSETKRGENRRLGKGEAKVVEKKGNVVKRG